MLVWSAGLCGPSSVRYQLPLFSLSLNSPSLAQYFFLFCLLDRRSVFCDQQFIFFRHKKLTNNFLKRFGYCQALQFKNNKTIMVNIIIVRPLTFRFFGTKHKKTACFFAVNVLIAEKFQHL